MADRRDGSERADHAMVCRVSTRLAFNDGKHFLAIMSHARNVRWESDTHK